ncbi:DoxX family protein [Hoyosella sp. G463]|uniref:DoxX family protein n=1 Tax=Lolliginicoccus lacisalsi TaxID=2742202 RepID=A0A927JCQ5_9ACTN|nr:DoxX family protein [Lolliginicoccus lacisalsi]MBD8506755.1 DoxX family protein [Lolliginicoccus lacisalsi]
MDVVLLAGRILFSALFLFSAIGHLAQADAMAGYAKSKGVPFAKPATIASGIALAVGGLSVLLGVYGEIGAALLFLFLVPTAIIMHNFWAETDPAAKMNTQISFNKDIALAGATLALVWVFAQDPGLTVTSALL